MSVIGKICEEVKQELNAECLKVALAMRESKSNFYRFFCYALLEANYKQQVMIKGWLENEAVWEIFLGGGDVV